MKVETQPNLQPKKCDKQHDIQIAAWSQAITAHKEPGQGEAQLCSKHAAATKEGRATWFERVPTSHPALLCPLWDAHDSAGGPGPACYARNEDDHFQGARRNAEPPSCPCRPARCGKAGLG